MIKKTNIYLILISLFLLVGCAQEDSGSFINDSFSSFTSESSPTVSINTSFNSGAAVRVELARTQAEQELGLMFRNELGAFSGMLFIFNTEAVREFTMRDTFIPLDIIFIDSTQTIVDIERNTIPNTPGPYTTSIPFLYALEVNAGFSQNLGILPGDTVNFSGFDF